MRLLLIDGIQAVPPETTTDVIRPTSGRSHKDLKVDIAERFGNGDYDVIAVGNHRELGLELLKVVPRTFRHTVVVLSNDPIDPAVESKYRAQGVQHFSVRGEPFATFLQQYPRADSLGYDLQAPP